MKQNKNVVEKRVDIIQLASNLVKLELHNRTTMVTPQRIAQFYSEGKKM